MNLESPYKGGKPTWDALYRARGGEVSATRPIFTGDVFISVQLPGSTGRVKSRSVAVIQHPCSMRKDGVDLSWQVLVAEVADRREITEEEWAKCYFNLMPLPELRPDLLTKARHQAVNFDNLYTVRPDVLTSRIASLSPLGVNLLLQRWVHYSSRVIVPTYLFQTQTVSFYEEADLIEEWCDEVVGEDGPDVRTATQECLAWLRTKHDGATYQELLKDSQSHSTVRKAMRTELKSRNATPPA